MNKIKHRRCETLITLCERSVTQGTKPTHNIELRSSSTPNGVAGSGGAFTPLCATLERGYSYLPPSEVLETIRTNRTSEIGQSEIVLDISDLPNGVYFLRVGNETVKVVKK